MDLAPPLAQAPHAEAESYPERIRALYEQAGKTPPQLTEQRLDEFFLERIRERPGCLAPIFLQASLVKDDIAYAEVQRPLLQLSRYVAKWSRPPKRLAHHPLVVQPPQLAEEDFKQWRSELHTVVNKQVWPQGETVTEEDLLAHLSLFAPTVMASLTTAQQTAWMEWCAGALEPAKLEPYTERADRLDLIVTCEIERGGAESRLIDVFRERAARVGSHRIEAQRLGFQGGRIGRGKCFELKYAGGSIRYVPHGDLGDIEVEIQSHRATSALSEEQQAAVRQSFDTEFAAQCVDTTELVCRISRYTADDRPERVEVIRLGVDDEERGDLVAAMHSHFTARHGAGSATRERDVEVHAATDALIEDKRIPERYRLMRTQWGWTSKRSFKQWQNRHAAFTALMECADITYSTNEGQSVSKGLRRAMQKRFKEHARLREITELLNTSEAGSWFALSTSTETVTRKLKHRAPLSERGLVTLRGLRLDQVCAALIEFGIAKGASPSILEEHTGQIGRVIPRHPAYLLGEEPPTLPHGFAIFHTLTGAADAKSIFSRLGSMARYGGIASFSERRRLGIDVPSLDPTGDAIQGIDFGVPTSIGRYPPYAQYGSVSFLIKPEALTRRDIWFSDETGWSFKHYLDYAKLIGQGKFFAPCPPEAAKTHLQSTLGPANEVYFSYVIPWEDVDSLVVSDKKLAKKIEAALATWHERGLIPAGIHVLAGSRDEVRPQIKERAAALRAGDSPSNTLAYSRTPQRQG